MFRKPPLIRPLMTSHLRKDLIDFLFQSLQGKTKRRKMITSNQANSSNTTLCMHRWQVCFHQFTPNSFLEDECLRRIHYIFPPSQFCTWSRVTLPVTNEPQGHPAHGVTVKNAEVACLGVGQYHETQWYGLTLLKIAVPGISLGSL